jgi:catechol 2,3-dioxygenase-like lactoylglutathione lyase family enzyme
MSGSPGAERVTGVLTMFYYEDLPAAADWYVNKLGFERVQEFEGLVLLRIEGTSHLALIGAGYGSQRPFPGRDKGAILSIQTDALEQWHERLSAMDVEGAGQGLRNGAGGRTVEFKVYDPEGYTIEFFSWIG